MAITVTPADASRFDDVATMVGPVRADANSCWCLSHRLDSRTNGELRGADRGAKMRELCAGPIPPGVLAHDGDTLLGWASVGRRADLPVARSTVIPQVDDLDVWSIICLRTRPRFRGRGASDALVQGAFDFAVAHGAPAVEAYPVDNRGEKVDQTMAFVGLLHVFERNGFEVVSPTDAVAGGFPRVLVRRSA